MIRTVALVFGCGIIYTNKQDICTLEVMKNYILYMLFKQPKNYINTQSTNNNNSIILINSYFQTFETQPQIYKNTNVFIPSGFDSFNKIKIIENQFDCDLYTQYIIEDIENMKKLFNNNKKKYTTLKEFYKNDNNLLKIANIFEEKIAKNNKELINNKNNEQKTMIRAIDEQTFLKEMHELLKNTQQQDQTTLKNDNKEDKSHNINNNNGEVIFLFR